MSNDWSEFTAWIAATAFVMASFYLLARGSGKGIPRSWDVLVAWGVVLAFVAALLWSMWSETLHPLIQQGAWGQVWLTGLGLLLILASVGTMVYGGCRFVMATLHLLSDETFQQNAALARKRQAHSPAVVRAARRSNFQALLRAWRPGTAWFFLGFGLLALGCFFLSR
ncbi:MAG: hypothetical protein NUW24_13130 [Anaerolineae bacterium]|jgi:hypothetical protein|nr:hypothetical protein [Anaerolineae bacterium]MDH7473037.1 hypothetical protein [Anaerolineae bacterium]